MSISPGKIVSPRASISWTAGGSEGVIAVMRSSSIATSARTMPAGVMTAALRIARSDMADEPQADLDGSGDVGGQHGFVRRVADAARAAKEEHRSGNVRGEDHGVVSRAAGQVMYGIAGGLDSLRETR